MNDVQFNEGGKLTAWSYFVISHPGPHSPYDSMDPMEDMAKFTKTLKRVEITGQKASPGRKLVLKSPDDPTLESLIQGAAAKFNLLLAVGIDVTHPSLGSAQADPSIAGMVASIDKYVSKFPGIVLVQSEARQEMVSATTEMLKSHLRLWKGLGKHEAFPGLRVVHSGTLWAIGECNGLLLPISSIHFVLPQEPMCLK